MISKREREEREGEDYHNCGLTAREREEQVKFTIEIEKILQQINNNQKKKNKKREEKTKTKQEENKLKNDGKNTKK